MSDPIQYALSHIRARIPIEILKKVFFSDPYFDQNHHGSMDYFIRRDVIEGTVMTDLNLIGGEHCSVPLDRIRPIAIEGALVYQIPLSATNGRYISRVFSVENTCANYENEGSSLGDLNSQLLTATAKFSTDSTARVRLVGPNTVLVEEAYNGLFTSLRCVLTYDEHLSSLNPSYYRTFAELCKLACEATIFNQLSISLDSGSSLGGTPNARLLSRVDRMEEAAAKYDELLETKAHKMLILGDKLAHRDHIRILLPS